MNANEHPSNPSATGGPHQERMVYVAPSLIFVGLLTEVVKSGKGKLSVDSPDGPDTRKPPGQ